MDLRYCKNISPDTYEVLIHGEIGDNIIGANIASEILYLNQIGAKVIKERINTVGGTVSDAFSIVSANLASTAEIHTINEGIADSCGSWILASGNKRSGYDFSSAFLHNVTVAGKQIDEISDENVRNNALMMQESIITILSNNTGKSKEEIKGLMDANTRMNADETKDLGLIDEILESTNKPLIMANMSLVDIMNVCSDLNNDNTKIENKMDIKELENKVENLDGQLTVKDGLISDLEKKVSGKDTEISQLENKVTEKETDITELENKVKAFEVKEIENAVKSAIDSGKFTEENKEALETQCTSMGVENFNVMVGMVKIPQASAAAQIKNSEKPKEVKDADKQKALAEEYKNLSTTDQDTLIEIKNSDPKRFEAMLNAFNES